jgi:phosphohistidine phosphatase
MDLILWRHAEAEEGSPDIERALTEKGHKQAKKMAQWLKARLPEDARILVSPAVRAQQTALALTRDFITVDEIAPEATHEAVLKAAGWPRAGGTVLIVGHQPTLGLVIGQLLTQETESWSVKKGAVWWLCNRKRGNTSETILRASIAPGLL